MQVLGSFVFRYYFKSLLLLTWERNISNQAEACWGQFHSIRFNFQTFLSFLLSINLWTTFSVNCIGSNSLDGVFSYSHWVLDWIVQAQAEQMKSLGEAGPGEEHVTILELTSAGRYFFKAEAEGKRMCHTVRPLRLARVRSAFYNFVLVSIINICLRSSMWL